MSPFTGLLERLPGHREGRQAIADVASVREDLQAMRKSDATLLSGQPVKGRFAQNLAWSVPMGLLAALVPAGLYFGVLEVHWYIWIGSFHVELFDFKQGWDNLIRYDWWKLYRHAAFRDLAEPAAASMAVKTILASRKWWGKPAASSLRIVTAPLVVVFLIVALGVAGTWVINFSGPWAWEHVTSALGHPGFKVSAHFLGKLSVPQLVLGLLVIGPIVHRYWAPVGATLQGFIIDRSVDRRQAIVQRAQVMTGMADEHVLKVDSAGWHIVPLWERKPLVPPPVRERFAYGWRHNAEVSQRKAMGRWQRRLFIAAVVLVIAVIVLLMALGFIGHYWVGVLHHSVPYFAP